MEYFKGIKKYSEHPDDLVNESEMEFLKYYNPDRTSVKAHYPPPTQTMDCRGRNEEEDNFYCLKHSNAAIRISLGTDIYAVSKMLTHKNVTTTQIYADLVNSKKLETANKISPK